jgi:ubiquitin C-terminal hydrolase
MSKLHEELNITRNEADLNISTNSNKNIDTKNENDALIDFLQNFTNKNNSVIVKNVYGIIKNVLYCHKCQNSFFNFYIYSYFNFNLSKILEYKQSKYNNTNITLDIYDCLDYYQKAQTLLGDKAIFCPDCKEQTESTSLKNIYSTKNILIFIFENNKENFDKNYFDYTEMINMRDYVEYKKDEKKSKEKFYLCGIVNFSEDNYGNETFIAYCRMGKNNDWYCYDNENIYPVTFQQIKNNGIPIVLFYHKLIRK